MKFIISTLLMGKVFASPIYLYHENETHLANQIGSILTENFLIPQELITTLAVDHCSIIRNSGKLILCLNKNGDLLEVSVDQEFINNSLKVFYAP